MPLYLRASRRPLPLAGIVLFFEKELAMNSNLQRGLRRPRRVPLPGGVRGGFTLIELLVVIAIIAILARKTTAARCARSSMRLLPLPGGSLTPSLTAVELSPNGLLPLLIVILPRT